MNALGRGLAWLAIAGQIGLAITDADARPGGPAGASGAAGGHGVGVSGVGPRLGSRRCVSGVAPGLGVSGGHYGSVGVTGVTGANGGHYGVSGYGGQNGVSGYGGQNGNGFGGQNGNSGFSGVYGRSDPAPGFAFFGDFTAMSNTCGADLQLFDPGDYVDPIDRVAAISQQTQSFLQFSGCDSQARVADALDKYADALEQAMTPPAAPQSTFFFTYVPHKAPRVVRELPKIVREAAARVRVAKTPHAAVAIVKAAIEEVQKKVDKTIALMRAADSDAESPATRGTSLVAATLKSAAETLERADTL